jgi:hypothetical protein
MLVIRRDQMRTFELNTRLAKPQPYIDHLVQCHPETAASIGGSQLPDYVRSVLKKAYHYGATTNHDYCRFLDLAVLFGLDWSLPNLQWLHQSLSDAAISDPSIRFARTYRRAIFRLELGG